MSNNTHGSRTIIDRVSGWGHTAGTHSYENDTNAATMATVNGNADTLTTNAKEVTEERSDRLTDQDSRLSMDDTFDTGNRDGEYFYTAEADTVVNPDPDTDTEFRTGNGTSTGRTSFDTDFQLLNDSTAEKRAEAERISIIDRGFIKSVLHDDVAASEGTWGHSSGSLPYRSDAGIF